MSAPQPTPSDELAPGAVFTAFSLVGWSRGYVGFRDTESNSPEGERMTDSIVPSHSTDGLHWTDGAPLDLSGFRIAEFLTGVVEGPAGLLAAGKAMQALMCGGPTPINAFWISPDGASWRRLNMSAFGGGTVYQIDAGSAGYVATGYGAGSVAVPFAWTSRDGVKWAAVNLNTATFKGIQLTNATAFKGGFVLAGSVPADDGGCGGGSPLRPSLWWSADGKVWTRDSIAGTTDGDTADMTVRRVTDDLLLACESTHVTATDAWVNACWVSADGRTWSPGPARITLGSWLIRDGRRAVLSEPIDSAPGRSNLWLVGNNLSLTPLAQTGALPTDALAADGYVVLGPNGLVAANADGTRFWAGVPTAG